MATCSHCGATAEVSGSAGELAFCCAGCEAAYGLVQSLGLGRYYERRQIDPAGRSMRPDDTPVPVDYATYVSRDGSLNQLNLMVEGVHCAACVWLIESALARDPRIEEARVNLSTRRLHLKWRGVPEDAQELVGEVSRLGYRLIPYDPEKAGLAAREEERDLLRAMAVAGFAAANVMLLSVALWAGLDQGMGPATRELMHWISALIALPAIMYAGRPFFRSARRALVARRLNMDVPISLAVVLAGGMSLFETMQGGAHVYFDSACALLFFLLVGRYLDRRTRGRARSAAEQLVGLTARAVTVLEADGSMRIMTPDAVQAGMVVLSAPGERVAVDGVITDGTSDIDAALLTGESTPEPVCVGDKVFAGTLNVSGALRIAVSAVGDGTVLADISRLMEAAERGRHRYVALADRVARHYAPVVHALGAATFIGWMVFGGVEWQAALLTAVAVLIITCPCALALAVPMVQVVVSGRLMRQGVLLKSATALEQLARVDTVIFDKTGTLTHGRPLLDVSTVSGADQQLAASLAAASRHPLAQALVRATPNVVALTGVREVPGAGLAVEMASGEVRLGNRRWCDVDEGGGEPAPELWLRMPLRAPQCFTFRDEIRADAMVTISRLKEMGLQVGLVSGDREPAVKSVAEQLGIENWRAANDPASKIAFIEGLMAGGRQVLMVGDGLNDAPALAAAHVSASPSSAADISQTAADIVFQGDRLAPVFDMVHLARRAERLIWQNLALAVVYNVLTIPLAIAGFATPLIAAAAMSSSSLLVVGNALRLTGRKSSWMS
jgi:P-type Cu2+ transporter